MHAWPCMAIRCRVHKHSWSDGWVAVCWMGWPSDEWACLKDQNWTCDFIGRDDQVDSRKWYFATLMGSLILDVMSGLLVNPLHMRRNGWHVNFYRVMDGLGGVMDGLVVGCLWRRRLARSGASWSKHRVRSLQLYSNKLMGAMRILTMRSVIAVCCSACATC